MDKPDNLRVGYFCLCQIYHSSDLQDKQHVAQYLGKLYFVNMKRISFSDNALNALLFLRRVKMIK